MDKIFTISLSHLNRYLLHKQNLLNAVDVHLPILVERLGGLHATVSTTPYLSLKARLINNKRHDLDGELFEQRSMGRIRCVRKTMYVHTTKMMPAMYQATYRKSLVEVTKQMERQGITVWDYDRIADRILYVLKGNPMTAKQLKQYMGAPQPLSGLLNRMCELGLLARAHPAGSWKSQAYHYALFEEYHPEIDLHSISEEEARIEVVRAYLSAFGPARFEDIVWWTDFSKSQVRAAFKKLKKEVIRIIVKEMPGEFYILCKDLPELGATPLDNKTLVSMLPMLDPYLMAYKERGRYIKEEHYGYIYDRTGNAAASIMLNGEIIGVWDLVGKDDPLVKVFLMRMVNDEIMGWIYQMAEKMGEFMAERSVRVKRVRDMVPVSEQGVGKVLSPLKDS